ncbi:hypothetical protein Tco_1298662 [Tanacetum coccineum]
MGSQMRDTCLDTLLLVKLLEYITKGPKRVEENLHIDFLEHQPNVARTSPDCMFDLDFLTNTMNYIPVSVENQVHVDAGAQDSYVTGSSGKDNESTQEYILLPLHPHRLSIPVEDVDSEDVDDKEEQKKMTDNEQALQDELEKMVAQEVVAKALDDATRHAFKEEKRKSATTQKADKATSTNLLSTDRPFVSTANTNNASSTPGRNAGESSFVYLGGRIPIDASTLPNADLPTDPNMPGLKDASDEIPNEGIFSRAYDDEDMGAVADFSNMDNTIMSVLFPHLEFIRFIQRTNFRRSDISSSNKRKDSKGFFSTPSFGELHPQTEQDKS